MHQQPHVPSGRLSVRNVSAVCLRAAILAAVAWGITQAINGARADLVERSIDWNAVNFGGLATAAGLYFLAQISMGWFWQQTLIAFGQRAGFFEAFRAFFVGHLGKYVPGKFLVVVLRSGLIGQSRVDPVLAGISVFVETLTGMACGACLAATILFFWFPDQTELQLLAIGLMLATVVGTLPPSMRRLIQLVQRRRGQPVAEGELSGINYGLMAKGWLAAAVMWGMTAICFWCVLRALPGLSDLAFDLQTLARLAASVCLAVVAGFVSLIPGGLGIREWVLNELLVPEFGAATAFVAAVALRIVMLLTEVVGSTILYISRVRS